MVAVAVDVAVRWLCRVWWSSRVVKGVHFAHEQWLAAHSHNVRQCGIKQSSAATLIVAVVKADAGRALVEREGEGQRGWTTHVHRRQSDKNVWELFQRQNLVVRRVRHLGDVFPAASRAFVFVCEGVGAVNQGRR